jgi:predicted nucleic acid-binding protein
MNQESKFFLDTNILVHYSLKDYDPVKYKQCFKLINDLLDGDYDVFLSTQVLREFFAVVTNPRYIKNPLSIENANDQIQIFHTDFDILPVDYTIITKLIKLTEKYQITGQDVHDTAIVATMIQNNVKNVVTYNRKDFEKFKEIKVIIPDKNI